MKARPWLILLLCGLAGMLFYIDRQTLSVLKTSLKGSLGWSDVDYGWLVDAFMGCYTIGYLFTGRWVDRWGTRRMMPLFFGLMSLSTVGCAYVRHLGAMAACRGLLGLAEAGIVPAVLVAIFQWFPETQRGLAATIREPLNVAGQIIVIPMAVAFTERWGWQYAFLVPGLSGLILAGAWWCLDRPRRSDGPVASFPAAPFGRPHPTSYLAALRRREIWGIIAARMISDPLWFFFLYWEPGFLQERVGLSLGELRQIGWIPTAVATLSLILFGFCSDRLIARRGCAPARSRRLILQGISVLAPVMLALPVVRSHALAIALLCVARVMMLGWLSLSTLFMADLVPQPLIGTSVALMSAFGAAMALLCNTFVGPAITRFGYGPIFYVGAAAYPLAALILWQCYGRRRPAAALGLGGTAPAST